MSYLRFTRLLPLFTVVFLLLSGHVFAQSNPSNSAIVSPVRQPLLDVYKRPAWSCCVLLLKADGASAVYTRITPLKQSR